MGSPGAVVNRAGRRDEVSAGQVSAAWAPGALGLGRAGSSRRGLALMSPLFSPLLNFGNLVVEIQARGQALSESVAFEVTPAGS